MVEPITNDFRLILASNSPRRKQLLSLAGWQFHHRAAPVDESPSPGEDPRRYALRLAESKARAGASLNPTQDELVIGSDTIVVDDQTGILGKPADAEDATRMLERLGGRTHQVVTAVAVYRPSDGLLLNDLCATKVTMRNYSGAEIQAYVASGDPLDKAGAYAIQHPEFNPVEQIRGCFANVVGLPVCLLNQLLARFGLTAPLALPGEGDHTHCPLCLRIIQEGLP